LAANIEKESPYYSADGVPRLRPSFVCYADILGYSELSKQAIERGNGSDFLKRLSKTLTETYDAVRKTAKGFSERDQRYFDIKIFTDNIVIGYPIHNVTFTQGESELGHIFDLFSELQMKLALEGFLLRGGIAYGEHYMDNDIVFGDALLAAVKQDVSGGPPCLSLNETALNRVKGQIAFYGGSTSTPQHHYLREDSSGTVFLNYLMEVDSIFPGDGPLLLDLIKEHKTTVERGLNDYRSVPSVWSKYEWLARYHNYYSKEVAGRYSFIGSYEFDEERAAIAEHAQEILGYIIDIESFAAEPRPLSIEPLWHGGDM